ncbi:MAG: cell filamentation protein [Oleiphilaceae bacterium]|jgi:cell filamentation protein
MKTHHIKVIEFYSAIDVVGSDIVHIKKVKLKKGYTHIYWNKNAEHLIAGRNKVHGKVPSIAHIISNDDAIDNLLRPSLQIGDSVIFFCNFQIQSVLCATISGFRERTFGDKKHPKGQETVSEIHLISNTQDCHPTLKDFWTTLDKDRLILINNNLSIRKRAEQNITFAYYQDELLYIEEFYSLMRVPDFVRNITERSKVSFNQNLLQECHRQLFEGIYSWAGKIRNHEVVIGVGQRENPTMHHDLLKTELETFFKKIVSPILAKVKSNDKQSLTMALVVIHKYLADIHPFADGNGRVIRLFLTLIAIKYGFKMRIIRDIEKRYYQFAVRCSLKGFHYHLNKVIFKWLEKM